MTDYFGSFADPFTEQSPDALKQDWKSFELPLWCNPPFSRYEEFYDAVSAAPAAQIWVVNHDHSTKLFKKMFKDADYICLLDRRIRFIDPRTMEPAKRPSSCNTLFFKNINNNYIYRNLEAFWKIGKILDAAF